MGADTFVTKAKGSTPRKAFRIAVDEALYEHGHGGYTGSIAEKPGFQVFSLPKGMTVGEFVDAVLDPSEDASPEVLRAAALADDKWADAVCVRSGENEYTFFGWASS